MPHDFVALVSMIAGIERHRENARSDRHERGTSAIASVLAEMLKTRWARHELEGLLTSS